MNRNSENDIKCACCGQKLDREARILNALRLHKKLTLSQVSNITGIHPSGCSMILHKLHEKKTIKYIRQMDSKVVLKEKVAILVEK